MQTTLKFLSALKKNNNREWFEANKEKYLAAKAETEMLLDKLIGGLMAKRGTVPSDNNAYGFYDVRLKESLRHIPSSGSDSTKVDLEDEGDLFEPILNAPERDSTALSN